MGIFQRLQAGLAKTRSNFIGSLAAVFSGAVDDDFFDELEDALICADVGVNSSLQLVDALRKRAKKDHIKERQELWQVMQDEITAMLTAGGDGEIVIEPDKLNIIVLTGVNGAGKTTTIGKLAALYTGQGKKVLLAAADTFRAAASEQLATWAERAGVGCIRQEEGADPAAVVYDAIQAAQARHIDVLLVDTAGRLQNKTNLMNELSKIGRVIDNNAAEAHTEKLLVLDAGIGQNAISQARLFGEAVELTGLILTKLDGTAKGGAVIGIVNESGLPVRMIGVGEKTEDLRPFQPADFAAALFNE